MADYIPYTPEEYAPEAPATASHFARWFMNWEAGFAGASGAPRLKVAAFGTLEAGEAVRLRADAEKVYGAPFSQPVIEFLQKGWVRFSFDVENQNAVVQVVRIRGGAVTILLSVAASASYVSKTVDFGVTVADALQIRVVTGSGTVSLKNVRLKIKGGDLWPISAPQIGVLEGNSYNV